METTIVYWGYILKVDLEYGLDWMDNLHISVLGQVCSCFRPARFPFDLHPGPGHLLQGCPERAEAANKGAG